MDDILFVLKLGILGDSLEHSLSPALHGFLLKQAGIEGEYQAYPTPPEALAETLARLVRDGVSGLNVTIPHKVSVLGLLDSVDEATRLIGAVNTVSVDADGKTHGTNTDVAGFLESLPPSLRETLSSRSVLVLGAGGASRAVLAALFAARVTSITLAARSLERARETMDIAGRLQQHFESLTPVYFQTWDPQTKPFTTLCGFDMVVNTTPVGMLPDGDASPLSVKELETLSPEAFVYDLIYRPAETRLLQHAKARGLEAQGGLEMLIHQGVQSFEVWTGLTLTVDQLDVLTSFLEGEEEYSLHRVK